MKKTTLMWRRAGAAALLLLVGAGQQALAQGPVTTGPTQGTPAATAVPIDGGASLLLAGSIAYGLRKLRQRRRK